MKRSAVLMATLAVSTSACGIVGISETERTICRELGRVLPSYSSQDTLQTREEGDRFLAAFYAVCPGAKPRDP